MSYHFFVVHRMDAFKFPTIGKLQYNNAQYFYKSKGQKCTWFLAYKCFGTLASVWGFKKAYQLSCMLLST